MTSPTYLHPLLPLSGLTGTAHSEGNSSDNRKDFLKGNNSFPEGIEETYLLARVTIHLCSPGNVLYPEKRLGVGTRGLLVTIPLAQAEKKKKKKVKLVLL